MADTQHDLAIGKDLIKGAMAGAAATWLMGQVTTWLYNREGADARERENQAREGKGAHADAAQRMASAVGIELSEERQQQVGQAIHWALGMAVGAAYGVMRKRWPASSRFMGLPFGVGVFLVMDELMNPVLGLTPGPRAFPWQAHARGFGGHLAYGAASELVLEGLNRVA